MNGFTESVVEQAALAWLEATGWQVAHGAEIAPDVPAGRRADYGEVVLTQRMRDALARLNPDLPAEALALGEVLIEGGRLMAKKASAFDPRPMMERAVEVMREWVPERRADGSPSPKVNAVLVRPDGSVVTAARRIGSWIGPQGPIGAVRVRPWKNAWYRGIFMVDVLVLHQGTTRPLFVARP